jgi:tRNA (uracil-5-)-methyltransferase TRM9
MQLQTINELIDLNRQFYQNFAQPFANTRRRIQPGVRRILNEINLEADWLDIGCGSGALALEWQELYLRHSCAHSSYLGIDFSAGLLAEAQKNISDLPPGLQIEFFQADIGQPDWVLPFQSRKFDGVLSFAVLHHIPGESLRLAILRSIRDLLKPGGSFIHSEWQFQNSPRLAAHVMDWSAVNLDQNELEPGDTLLDWRHTLPGQSDQPGLRYVHRFTLDELDRLAAQSGFSAIETFESDGQGGRLGLYQIWQAI